MQLVALAAALLINSAFLVVAALAASSADVNLPSRAFAGGVAAALAVCMALLVLARLRRLPAWGVAAMRAASIVVPLAWLAGSLDRGVVSGQEAVFLAIVTLLAWATWRLFRSLHERR